MKGKKSFVKRKSRRIKRGKKGIKGFNSDNKALSKVHKYWLTNPSPKRLHMPFPHAYRTTMEQSWNAIAAIGAASNVTNDFLCNGLVNILAGLTPAYQTGLNEPYVFTAKRPAGLSNIMQNLYNQYHVISTKMTVKYLILTTSDSLIVGLTCLSGVAGAVGPTTIGLIQQTPQSITKTITTGCSDKERTLSIQIQHNKFSSVELDQYLSDPQYGGNYLTNPTGNYSNFFRLIAQTGDNLVTTAPMNIEIRFEFDVLFSNSTTGNLLDI